MDKWSAHSSDYITKSCSKHLNRGTWAVSHVEQTSKLWKRGQSCFPPVGNHVAFPTLHSAQLVLKGSDTAFKSLVMSVCSGSDGFMEGTGESTDGKDFCVNETKDVLGDIAWSRTTAEYSTHMLSPLLLLYFYLNFIFFSFPTECSCSLITLEPSLLSLTHLTPLT